jgi:hypothetical protein
MEDAMTAACVTTETRSGRGILREVSRGKERLIAAASWLLGVVILLESDPAWAQITKVNTVMQNVQTVLTSPCCSPIHGLPQGVPQRMARRDAAVLTPSPPGRFQFTQIHRKCGCPFRRLSHQLTFTSPSREARGQIINLCLILVSGEKSGRGSPGEKNLGKTIHTM